MLKRRTIHARQGFSVTKKSAGTDFGKPVLGLGGGMRFAGFVCENDLIEMSFAPCFRRGTVREHHGIRKPRPALY